MYINCHFFAILVVFGQRVESDIGGSIECGRRFREGSKPRVTHFDHDSPASSRRKRVCLCRHTDTSPTTKPGIFIHTFDIKSNLILIFNPMKGHMHTQNARHPLETKTVKRKLAATPVWACVLLCVFF